MRLDESGVGEVGGTTDGSCARMMTRNDNFLPLLLLFTNRLYT